MNTTLVAAIGSLASAILVSLYILRDVLAQRTKAKNGSDPPYDAVLQEIKVLLMKINATVEANGSRIADIWEAVKK